MGRHEHRRKILSPAYNDFDVMESLRYSAENHLGKVLDDHIDRADQGVAEVDLAQIAERFSIQAFSNMAFGQNLAESDVRVISRTVSKGQLGFMVMTMFPWIRICIGDPSALLKLDQYVAFGKTLATVKKTATDRLAGTMYAPSMTTTSLKITHADIISGLQATDLNAEQIADNLNVQIPHPNCVELDRIANEVLGRTPPVQAGPAHIDARDGVGPYDTPLPSPALQTPAIPVSDGSLPAAWSSDSNNNPSPEMIIAIIRRTELQNMIPEFATALKDLETAVGPSNPHFTQVIEFVTQHITGASLAADIHVSMIQEAEFQIANNIGDRNTARWNIDWIIRGITNTSPGFESAVIWHRRYTDLIIHLRRLAGRLSPPRPAATDEMPPPLPVRRGASAGIDPADLDDHSDFLPPPEFYLPEDAFDSDDDVEFDPDEDEQFGGDDEEGHGVG
ncbi:unnamed protein product [Aureobasidium pullulans]|nr:unnamed protein product [Aureobasidium pullulans]